MTRGRRAPAVTPRSLGAWLVKVNPAGGVVDELARSGFAGVATRCVRPSYRTTLVRAEQPVLLWVSGTDPRHVAGLHAHGVTTGPVVQSADGLAMTVRLRALDSIVPREQLLAHPVLRELEVLRMPAGSNPSFLDVDQYAALREAYPQVDHPAGRGPGTA